MSTFYPRFSQILAFLIVFESLSFSKTTFAQVPITSDNTTSTQVISSDNLNFTIEQGTLQAGSLFHSFNTFSVPDGGSAWFNNPSVAHIFARVTGSSASNINGLIRTNGTANLVLINPQGIQFGPNTSLNIGGSFLASTAEAVIFRENQRFSAVSPQAAPLLTVSTPVGLQFGSSPGDIQVQSSLFGFSVPPQQTLALVGGDVTLQSSFLTAASGRIVIGSVANSGVVPVSPTTQPAGWTLNFDQISEFGDISLTGEIVQFPMSTVQLGSRLITSVSSIDNDVSGDISLWGRNITLTGGSILDAGNTGNQLGGNILLNATETIQIIDRPIPGVRSIPSGLVTATFALGPAGNIEINAKNFSVSGETVAITASSSARKLFQGGEVVTIPATGAAGNILFNVTDSITVSDGAFIGASSSLGLGTSGQIELNSSTLNILRGGRIEAFTTGPNPAGEIIINASKAVRIDGVLSEQGTSSSLVSLSERGATGVGGPITINTDLLQVSNGGIVSAQTNSVADAGKITVNANQVSLLNGGQLISTTSNQGAAGQIELNVQNLLTLSGTDATFAERLQQVDELRFDPFTSFVVIPIGVRAESSIISSALDGTSGPGGSIDITTGQLQIARQGMISSSTAGPNNAGKIDISAVQAVSLTDPGSGVFAQTTDAGRGGSISFFTPHFLIEKEAVVNASTSENGPGGNIFVQANRFTASQGGQLLSTTSGPGPAGDITLQVRDNITLTGANSGLFANTTRDSSGAAGSIFIDPIQVLIANGAAVSVTSLGTGEGGDIRLRARNLTLDRGQITAESQIARAGDIQLDIDNLLLLRNGSLISTTTGGDAMGGNIDINALFVIAFPVENSDITANALNGPGGKITITTQGLFGLKIRDSLTNQSDITAFSQNNPELNGVVEIITPEADPSENLSEQPDTVEKPAKIAKGCKAQTAGSSFVNKGRGGLPQNPAAALSGEAVWQDLRTQRVQPTGQPVGQVGSQRSSQVATAPPSRWVEAKGWQRLPDGKMRLVGHSASHHDLPPTVSC
ncbi:S-layer family protein [Acaryochloris sp. IP29b_bin.137]|uniref:S-layer family protein n=1 Tax=Acaryochloris sp. IP29b_bin.137 TaxID=2969217 RepID=UPI00262FF056|nr:S-layer family protein [Acaryochloris sp. IP29b_bin.137]